MNLIEKLGGYDEAKKHLDSCWCDDDNKVYLLGELLKYRRKHEFFDEGDKVVIPKENKLAKFNESYMDIYVVDNCFMDHGVDFISFTCKGKIYTYATAAFKHATDEEIKAGHRV